MSKKQKLELTWIGKDDEVRLEPRVLIEDPELSYGDTDTENIIIHGDNLLALKALEQDYAGKVKCIYIDPPYNTGQMFEHYDDGIEHSLWLSQMNFRLKYLKNLLREDGVIFVNIDEINHAYLKIMMNEIFGIGNFLGDLIWKKRKGGGNDSRFFALDHDYIIVFAKNSLKEIHPKKWKVSQSEKYLKRYKETAEDGRKYYWDTLARDGLQNPIPVTVNCPDGSTLSINSQKSEDTISKGLENGAVRLKQVKGKWTLHHRVYMNLEGQVLRSILDEVGTNKTANDEMKSIFGNQKAFNYPKPESLIEKILELCTNENDLVFDSFLGSGTTAAVAHKMKRRYIGVELGEQAHTLVAPRLKQIIDGNSLSGSKCVGGGGFKFYTLAPSLLRKDKFDNWIIEPSYNADLLASALAKQEAFTYHPDSELFWKQGYSTENDFIFTTTQFITVELIDRIHNEMSEDESLLVCAKTFQDACLSRYDNITLKKIPKVLLGKCEFAKDDYSLNITETEEVEADDE